MQRRIDVRKREISESTKLSNVETYNLNPPLYIIDVKNEEKY
jgi:hypothetical protein